MKAAIKPVSPSPGIISIIRTTDGYLFIQSADSQPPTNSLTLHKQSQQPRSPALQCHHVGPDAIGRHFQLDKSEQFVFLTLRDDLRLAVFRTSDLAATLSDFKLVDLAFHAPVFALRRISNAAHSVIAAVSSSGEVVLLQPDLDIVHQKRLVNLNLSVVLATSTFAHDHLIVYGIRQNALVFIALHIAPQAVLSNTRVTISAPVALPLPPTSAFSPAKPEGAVILQSACLFSQFAVMIFSDGFVNIVAATSKPASTSVPNSLDLWFRVDNTCGEVANTPASIQSFTLSPRPVSSADTPLKRSRSKPVGMLAPIGNHFLAISYGECISLWDIVYHVPHGYEHLGHAIHTLQSSESLPAATIAHAGGVDECHFVGIHVDKPPKLIDAIKCKSSCDAIISSMRSLSENSPMRAHAITAAPIQAAADAGGHSPQIFLRALESERTRELHEVKAVLNASATPSATSLRALARDYTVHDTKASSVRKSARRLPSDRFAAAFVARCLYEMTVSRDGRFAVPLIDMIGTGVVSAEGVLAALEVSGSWNVGKHPADIKVSTMSELVTKLGGFVNVLEAMIHRIADLSEVDIVLMIQYAVWLSDESRKGQGQSTVKAKKAAAAADAQARRLLSSCVRAGIEKDSLLKCLVQLPFESVVLLLNELERFLKDSMNGVDGDMLTEINSLRVPVDEDETSEEIAEDGKAFEAGDGMQYRGLGRWLDKERCVNVRGGGKTASEGCVEWIGHILDAQLSNLILNENGRQVAASLLATVSQQRRQNEALQDLQGMACHLSEKRSLPRRRDPRYNVTVAKLPHEGAL